MYFTITVYGLVLLLLLYSVTDSIYGGKVTHKCTLNVSCNTSTTCNIYYYEI